MSTFKRSKVVMLPTKEKASLAIRKDKPYVIMEEKHSPWELYGNRKSKYFCEDHIYYNLYFLSDDEIKEGDWFLLLDDEYLNQSDRIRICRNKKRTDSFFRKEEYKKIIATTDKSLLVSYVYGLHEEFHPLPQPSQGFIQKYCEKGGIDEVIVEYIETKECDCHYHKFCKSHSLPEELHCERFGPKLYPKVSSDNTITIRPVKDSWSREEVIELCKLAAHNYSDVITDEDNWIKENL